MEPLWEISKTGVLPVVKIEAEEHAVPLAGALMDGGIRAMEVTARSGAAFGAIAKIRKTFPNMIVGAGTILNEKLADEAVAAGAQYVVSPGYRAATVRYCQERGVPIVPGCVTSSEIEEATSAGLGTLKFFPAEPSGGVAALKLLAGPFPKLTFIPTGGITMDNLESYLRLDCVAACGGSFMAPADAIGRGDWKAITALCREAVQRSLGFELAHVGINCQSENEALGTVDRLDAIFGLGIKNGNSSAFLGKAVECMKSRYYGAMGHIGFYTNSCIRARAWFESRGVAIREESLRYNAAGKLMSFYLAEEACGFALHVVAR